MRLQGKIALITGGASGFGRATALRFTEEGARVAIADLDEEWGKQTLALLEARGGPGELIVGDIATAEGAERAVSRTVERFGGLDVLVNNAGIAQGARADSWNMPEEMWDRVLRVNLKSVYLCSRAAIPHMLARGAGAIVNVASISASSAVGGVAYGASKGGVLSYTRHAAIDLAGRGIRVNAVSPGFMRTPMATGERRGASAAEQQARMDEFSSFAPVGRHGEADDIANAIVYLASDEARYVTGTELVVDGGYLVRRPAPRPGTPGTGQA
jgi:NAD(P)-dependent dehydrogenase (short-subunit alcohol dehydrogenase family)